MNQPLLNLGKLALEHGCPCATLNAKERLLSYQIAVLRMSLTFKVRFHDYLRFPNLVKGLKLGFKAEVKVSNNDHYSTSNKRLKPESGFQNYGVNLG